MSLAQCARSIASKMITMAGPAITGQAKGIASIPIYIEEKMEEEMRDQFKRSGMHPDQAAAIARSVVSLHVEGARYADNLHESMKSIAEENLRVEILKSEEAVKTQFEQKLTEQDKIIKRQGDKITEHEGNIKRQADKMKDQDDMIKEHEARLKLIMGVGAFALTATGALDAEMLKSSIGHIIDYVMKKVH